MGFSVEEFYKLCEAEKYFKRLYDNTERYIYIKKEPDGLWHVLRYTYADDWHISLSLKDNDLGSYKTRKLAKEAREAARLAQIRMPVGAKFGEPATFVAVLKDNEDYAQLNRHI